MSFADHNLTAAALPPPPNAGGDHAELAVSAPTPPPRILISQPPSSSEGRPRATTLSVRPRAAPTYVFTRLMVHSVDEVNTIKQEWKADVELEMKFILRITKQNREELLGGGFWPELRAAPEGYRDMSQREAANDAYFLGAPLKRVGEEPATAAASSPAGASAKASPVSPSPGEVAAARASDAYKPSAKPFWGLKYATTIDFKNSVDAPLKASQRDVWVTAPVRVGCTGGGPPPFGVSEGDHFLVSVCQRVRTRFTQCFDLSNFPIDRQQLRIELLLKDERFAFASLPEILFCEAFRPIAPHPGGEVREEAALERSVLVDAEADYNKGVTALGTVSYFQPAAYQSPTNTAWQIFKRIGMETGSSWPDESRTGKEYSRARFLIFVNRRWRHLIWQVVVPYTVCTMITFTTAAIARDQVGERLQVISALLLTGVRLPCPAMPRTRRPH